MFVLAYVGGQEFGWADPLFNPDNSMKYLESF
jgi:hypothetical protein